MITAGQVLTIGWKAADARPWRWSSAKLEGGEVYYALGVFLLALFGLSISEVVGRFVFDHPLPWATEVCRFLLIWMIFLGASEVTKRGIHLTVGVSISRFVSPKTFKIINIFTNLLVIAALGIVAWYGAEVAYLSSHIMAPASGVPMWWTWAAVPINFTIMAVLVAVETIKLAIGKSPQRDDALTDKGSEQ